MFANPCAFDSPAIELAPLDFQQIFHVRKLDSYVITLLQTTNRKLHMAYRIAPFSMTLSFRQGHLPIACLFKCDFS